jgi:hypothetical protein
MDIAEKNYTHTQKERIQLDFSQESLQRLDELKSQIGAGTRGETIRQALRLFDWFINETDADSIIEVADKHGQVTARFKARLLHSTIHLN